MGQKPAPTTETSRPAPSTTQGAPAISSAPLRRGSALYSSGTSGAQESLKPAMSSNGSTADPNRWTPSAAASTSSDPSRFAMPSRQGEGESSRRDFGGASVSLVSMTRQDIPPAEIFPEELNGIDSTNVRLEEVFASVLAHYPALRAIQLQRQVASGQVLENRGAFDLTAKAYSLDEPIGFYENYRQGLGVEQPLYQGGYVTGGYRIGDGSFEPWYKERETNEGGELAIGVGYPLLKGRVIDERRAELLKSTLELRTVEPQIRLEVIRSLREGGAAYWSWVVAGQSRQAQARLLELAQTRVEQIEALIRAGDQPPVAALDNQRLLASREAKLIEADRKLATSALKLSLYLRDEAGVPIVPGTETLPLSFPPLPRNRVGESANDLPRALETRPEIQELALMRERESIALAKAENDLLPKLDAAIGASQDMGARATSTGDKSPLEVELGLVGEVPVQRRAARGKIQAIQAKMTQIDVKRQFIEDKVSAELSAAEASIDAALRGADRSAVNLDVARRALELARISFENGDIDLIVLNLYEQAVTDAELDLIEASASAFLAEIEYLAALGDLSPLVSVLPPAAP